MLHECGVDFDIDARFAVWVCETVNLIGVGQPHKFVERVGDRDKAVIIGNDGGNIAGRDYGLTIVTVNETITKEVVSVMKITTDALGEKVIFGFIKKVEGLVLGVPDGAETRVRPVFPVAKAGRELVENVLNCRKIRAICTID